MWLVQISSNSRHCFRTVPLFISAFGLKLSFRNLSKPILCRGDFPCPGSSKVIPNDELGNSPVFSSFSFSFTEKSWFLRICLRTNSNLKQARRTLREFWEHCSEVWKWATQALCWNSLDCLVYLSFFDRTVLQVPFDSFYSYHPFKGFTFEGAH